MYCIGLPQVRRPRGAVLCSGSYRVTIKELAARCPHLRLRVLFQAHSGWWTSSLCCRPEVPIFSFLLTVGEVLAKWPSQHDGLPGSQQETSPESARTESHIMWQSGEWHLLTFLGLVHQHQVHVSHREHTTGAGFWANAGPCLPRDK